MKVILKVAVVLILFVAGMGLGAFHPKYSAKIEKNVRKTLGKDQFELKPLHKAPNATGGEAEFWQITSDNELAGYLVTTQGKGRTDTFDFMIVYFPNGTIRQVHMLEYRSQQGYGIGSRGWLAQFVGKPAFKTIRLHDDVDGLTGATASVHGIIQAINDAGALFFPVK